MQLLFIIIFIAWVIFSVNSDSKEKEKCFEYIRQRGGKFVSRNKGRFDYGNILNKYSQSYKLVYYDKNDILRAVFVRTSTNRDIEFIDDHQVHSNDIKYLVDEEYINQKQKTIIKQEEKTLVDYHYNNNTIIIKQQFYNPNKGEFVFLNNTMAPDGKYKLGFMNFVTVKDGKVKDLTML